MMVHKGTAKIETGRLVLRRFEAEDVMPAFNNWMSDDAVTKYLRWPTHTNISATKGVINSWIEGYSNKKFYQWAIVLKNTNEPIGSISAVDMDEMTNMVHIGYCIGSKWWHMGYTSEAFGAVIKFFFDEVKVNRIESQHDPENENSGKVMKKCGLRYEGTHKEADWSNRGIVDADVYAILKREYYARGKRNKSCLAL